MGNYWSCCEGQITALVHGKACFELVLNLVGGHDSFGLVLTRRMQMQAWIAVEA